VWQEATVALLRTASVVNRRLARVLEPWELSTAQYNALRIVRGAGSAGIATCTIRERMIEEGTTITRLVDKLEEAGLIERERSVPDRRQVICRATAAGLALLAELDAVADEADEEMMRALDERQLEDFVEMLDAIRATNAASAAPRWQPAARPPAEPAASSGRRRRPALR
jgi:DNA-binding MarR family transcriptional regulator